MIEHIYVRLNPVGGYPPHDSEELDAEPLDAGDYIIRSVPVWARDLSREDRVATVVVDGRRYVDRIIEDGGHTTVRVVLFSQDPTSEETCLAELDHGVRDAGAAFGTPPFPGLWPIDVPPRAKFRRLEALLERGRDRGWWDIEYGTVAPEHRASTQ